MLQKSSTQLVADVFYQSPTKPHYLMDISRQTKIAHTSVKKNLRQLVKQGMITQYKEKRGSRIFPFYNANLDSRLFKAHKLAYNLITLHESGLIEYLNDTFAPRSVVLFGSYSRAEDVEDSDIDLFVQCRQANMELRRFEKKLGRKIELHFYEKFSTLSEEFRNNVINGITLAGFLEGYATEHKT
jgi:predicted nucleotidyltransferase